MAIAFWIGQHIFIQALERYRSLLTDETEESLQEMFVFVDVRSLWPVLVFLAIGVSLIISFFIQSVILVVFIASTILFLPRWLIARAVRKRTDKFESQLPEALLCLSSALRAGSSIGLALGSLVQNADTPLSQEFGLVLRENRVGTPLMTALNHLYARMPLEGVQMATTLINIATISGGSLADLLEKLSETLRERLHICMKIKVLTSQGKMQAWIVGSLPIVLIVVLSQIDPHSIELLFQTDSGRMVLLLVCILECCGIYILNRILRITP